MAQTRASLAHFDSEALAAPRDTETSLDDYVAGLVKLQRLHARNEALMVSQCTEELRQAGNVGGLVTLDAERSWVAA